ncbi:MAG TPA: potassium transporter TrkG, partial [Paludibacter sp.]|nr:potassium transporter TrkG [Paludibacter sp.]
FFIFIILAFTLLIGIATFDFTHLSSGANYESTFRNSLFTVMSVITTTGFSTVDYMNFAPFVWLLLMILMVTGSSAGSTAGGVKLIRVHIAMKFIYFRIKKIVHPNAVFPIKYNNQIMKNDIIMRVLAFILLYIVLIVVGSVILAASGMGFLESIGGMISCMGNVGVAFGEFGPSIGFSGLSVFAKWFLSAMMLIGRLELFTVFVLFTPIFWRK